MHCLHPLHQRSAPLHPILPRSPLEQSGAVGPLAHTLQRVHQVGKGLGEVGTQRQRLLGDSISENSWVLDGCWDEPHDQPVKLPCCPDAWVPTLAGAVPSAGCAQPPV